MGRFAGWGAGPAGAGAAGGPSRAFLFAALAGSAIVSIALLAQGRIATALVAAGAAVYFAFRLFAGLGRKG